MEAGSGSVPELCVAASHWPAPAVTPRLPANDRGKAGVLLSRPITTPEVTSIAAKEVTGDILFI